jgi:hypothetical protein
MNMIQPKNIQISKESTVKELKEKIIRCVGHFIYGQDNNLLSKVKLFLKNFGMSTKKDNFELICAYLNKQKSYKITAVEIIDENIKIEVIVSYIIIRI